MKEEGKLIFSLLFLVSDGKQNMFVAGENKRKHIQQVLWKKI